MHCLTHKNPVFNWSQSGSLPSEDRYFDVQKHIEISSKIFTGILSIKRGRVRRTLKLGSQFVAPHPLKMCRAELHTVRRGCPPQRFGKRFE